MVIPLLECAFCTHSACTETKVVLVACLGILMIWSFGITNRSHTLILDSQCFLALYIKSVVLLQGTEGFLLMLFVVD